MDVKIGIIEAISSHLRDGVKIGKTVLKDICASVGIVYEDNIGLVKESIEISLMHIAREISIAFDYAEAYAKIRELYQAQPTVGTDMTMRQMSLQQYSTSLPIAYLMSQYVFGDKNGLYFEPTAGNGFLTIALPQENTIVNEIDELRLGNLKGESYRKVTNNDALVGFDFGKIFDGVVMNPPFFKKGGTEKIIFNTMNCMKDSGKCAILRDGWDIFKEYYGTMQRSSNNPFFDDLFSEYNVEKIININSYAVYTKQGTGVPMQIILVNGRKPKKTDTMTHRVLNPDIDVTDIQDFDGLGKIFGELRGVKAQDAAELQSVEMKLLK